MCHRETVVQSQTNSFSWRTRKIGPLAIVLIDALRADFVLPHARLKAEVGVDYGLEGERPQIRFIGELLAKGRARCYVAQATPPTVTLPRLKVRARGNERDRRLDR